MNKKFSVKLIAINAMIAGVYAALTLLVSPIAYGGIQCRLSEVMVFLAFYNRKYIPGLTIGCILANITSPLGIVDVCFGSLSTLIVCISMYYIKNRYLAAGVGSVVTGIIVGTELAIVDNLPFFINAFYVFVGEFVILVIGAFIFKLLENNKQLMTFINE